MVLNQVSPLYQCSVDAAQIPVDVFPCIIYDEDSHPSCSAPECAGLGSINDFGTFWMVHALPIHAGTIGVLICSVCNVYFKQWSGLGRNLNIQHSLHLAILPGQVPVAFNYVTTPAKAKK
jgi:hypothetical protein